LPRLICLSGCGEKPPPLEDVSKKVPRSFAPASLADLDFLEGSWGVDAAFFDGQFKQAKKIEPGLARNAKGIKAAVNSTYLKFDGSSLLYFRNGKVGSHDFAVLGRAEGYVWIRLPDDIIWAAKKLEADAFTFREAGYRFPNRMVRLSEEADAARRQQFARQWEKLKTGPAEGRNNMPLKIWLATIDEKTVKARLEKEPDLIKMQSLVHRVILRKEPRRAKLFLDLGAAANLSDAALAARYEFPELALAIASRPPPGNQYARANSFHGLNDCVGHPGLLAAIWKRDGSFPYSPFAYGDAMERKPKELIDGVEELIAAGVPLDEPFTKRGETLLQLVLQYPEAAQIVLDAGADINAGNLIEKATQAELAFYLRHKADIPVGMLHQAVKRGDENRISMLLDAGVDVDQVDEQGNTSLCYAVLRSHNLVQLLLSRGADPALLCENDRGPGKLSPLKLATRLTARESMELLEAAGK